MTECSVCFEKFNNSTRAPVACNFCKEAAPVCKSCTQTYLLNSSIDPHCLHCKAEWNREFLVQSCGKSWVMSALKHHRENTLLEREKALLPATQEAAERELKYRRFRERMDKMAEEAAELRRKAAHLDSMQRRMWHTFNGELNHEAGEGKKQYTFHCAWEGCNGFVNEEGYCGICERKTCMKCLTPLGDDHACDPNDVETVKSMRKNTKPCPSCGMGIYKIDGCDQMWCTQCNTAFSWRTGQIETSTVHNPHYYEFLQNRGHQERNPLDERCGGLPDAWTLHRHLTKSAVVDAENLELGSVMNLHRFISHISRVDIPDFMNASNPNVNRNEDLRISHLIDGLTEAKWKKELQKREKKIQRSKEYLLLLTMVRDVMSEHFQSVLHMESLGRITESTSDLWSHIMNYSNEQFDIISSRYNTKNYRIHEYESLRGGKKYRLI